MSRDLSFRLLSALPAAAILSLSLVQIAQAEDQQLSQAALIEALQEGGVTLYIRHAATESDYADQVTADPLNCATQRVLSEEGWRDARQIGEAIAGLGIEIGTVTSSQYCRAWQTADLAFGRYQKTPALNFEPAEEYTDEQFAAMRARVLPLMHESVRGEVTVIVGHDDPFEAATGIYPEPQGVAYVVRTDEAGALSVLGAIGPHDWPTY